MQFWKNADRSLRPLRPILGSFSHGKAVATALTAPAAESVAVKGEREDRRV